VRRDGQAVEVLCASAEPLVLELLRADPDARDLEVGGASLEDAFLALTQRAAPAGAADADAAGDAEEPNVTAARMAAAGRAPAGERAVAA